MAEPPGPGPEDYDGHRAQMVAILERQRMVLEGVVHALHQGDDGWTGDQKELAETVALMVQGAGVSALSIIKLSGEISMNLRDCLGIARSICETALNVAYIAAEGRPARDRAKRHALQKSFRDINREASMGGFRIKIARVGEAPDPADHPELEAALAEFTRKGGREVTEWTPHSLSERIDVVRRKYGDLAMTFAVAVVSVYRHSSELLHGTYFGTYYFWTAGQETAPRSRAEMEYRLISQHFTTIFTASWTSLHGMTSVLCRELNLRGLDAVNSRLFEESARYLDGPLQNIRPPAAVASS